jgi:hyperosmotically inducible protein
MKLKLVTTCVLLGTLLAPMAGYTEDADKDRSSPKAFVKDAVITTKIKAEFAKDKQVSVRHIKVDTDNKGVVQLSGTAKSQEEVDKAVQIARHVKGVVAVENHIQISNDR